MQRANEIQSCGEYKRNGNGHALDVTRNACIVKDAGDAVVVLGNKLSSKTLPFPLAVFNAFFCRSVTGRAHAYVFGGDANGLEYIEFSSAFTPRLFMCVTCWLRFWTAFCRSVCLQFFKAALSRTVLLK